MARTVPNLKWWRAVSAGLVGGAVGCAGFLAVCAILPDVFGRLLGVSVMGLAIGLSIVVAEKLAREASVEVIWAPNEITTANLGERPVYIGGGREDDVFVRAFPARHANHHWTATHGWQMNAAACGDAPVCQCLLAHRANAAAAKSPERSNGCL